MTKQQALENIKAALPNAHAFKEELDVLENRPKKVKKPQVLHGQTKFYADGHCPECGNHNYRGNKYCINCGQALDWSE